ncbi:helix-turn-helix domain-containing protein [Changchengzhania lutea]|uniref:helix-turn-helix domain-containing protein n=1 Tax=Changchengzhania lutea TaxID=2049305 RepID=UPI00115DB938|nr:helix-turn-helix transcriptional regulator [Changchengzhania lutea]
MFNRLKIKEIREAKNLTQDDIVRLSGIPKRSYNDYESGKTDIPSSRLQHIAKALDVTVGVIFGFSDPETREGYEDMVFKDFNKYKPVLVDDSKASLKHSEDIQTIDDMVYLKVLEVLKPYLNKIELQDAKLAELVTRLGLVEEKV